MATTMTPDELVIATSQWKDNLNGMMIKVAIVTIIFLVTVILFFAIGNLREIAENWPRYRCNPAFMPFASNFGYDVKENFEFCLNSVFRMKASEIFTPVYGLLHNFTSIVQLVIDVTLGIRKLFSNFLLGMNSFIRNVRDRIQNLLFQLRMTFMRMNVLMNRVYGAMYSMIWMGTSAVTSGFNVSENSLVRFILDFCFDPATRIPLADGSVKTMADLRVGDLLADNIRVTSTFKFRGDQTPMVNINGVVVSSKHIVQTEEGLWVPAEKHPDAKWTTSLPEIICLNVEGHRFRTETGLLVADYDETESANVVAETQAIAEKALNGGIAGPTIPDYSLGFDSSAQIQLADNSWIPVSDIRLDDTLVGGNKVIGLVQEEAEEVCVLKDGLVLSAAQLIFCDNEKRWLRIGTILPTESSPQTLTQIITDRVGSLHIRKGRTVWIRDYREAPIPEMEDPYMNELCTSV